MHKYLPLIIYVWLDYLTMTKNLVCIEIDDNNYDYDDIDDRNKYLLPQLSGLESGWQNQVPQLWTICQSLQHKMTSKVSNVCHQSILPQYRSIIGLNNISAGKLLSHFPLQIGSGK